MEEKKNTTNETTVTLEELEKITAISTLVSKLEKMELANLLEVANIVNKSILDAKASYSEFEYIYLNSINKAGIISELLRYIVSKQVTNKYSIEKENNLIHSVNKSYFKDASDSATFKNVEFKVNKSDKVVFKLYLNSKKSTKLCCNNYNGVVEYVEVGKLLKANNIGYTQNPKHEFIISTNDYKRTMDLVFKHYTDECKALNKKEKEAGDGNKDAV